MWILFHWTFGDRADGRRLAEILGDLLSALAKELLALFAGHQADSFDIRTERVELDGRCWYGRQQCPPLVVDPCFLLVLPDAAILLQECRDCRAGPSSDRCARSSACRAADRATYCAATVSAKRRCAERYRHLRHHVADTLLDGQERIVGDVG